MKNSICVLMLFLSGCSYNWSGAKYGDKVKVTDGFYEGCVGHVTSHFTWVGPCQYDFLVKFTECPNGLPSDTYVSTCDMKVLK